MSKEKILIVGGGFGGVKAALKLSEFEKFKVTLISEDDSLRYYPTLYHTATGGKRANSSIPLNRIFAGKNVEIIKGFAKSVDRKNKQIITSNGNAYIYDTLILSLGVVTNYFGIPGLDKYSFSIKSQAEVEKFKQHLHKQLLDDKKPDLNYVIVGAGPTGIELAGALPDYLKRIMRNHKIRNRSVHVDLIEAMPRLLPRMPKITSRAVKRRLRKLGIKLYIGKAVQGQSVDELTVDGKPIRSHTVIWTAGVTNNPFFKENNFTITSKGKVSVDTYLQTEDNIFVLGDNANTPWSGMAQTALYDGKFVAKNLILRSKNKSMKSYIAKQPATVIPAGPHWAAVNWGFLKVNGKIGWFLREMADLSGFHYFEPWPRAIKQFLTEFDEQESCPVCAIASNR